MTISIMSASYENDFGLTNRRTRLVLEEKIVELKNAKSKFIKSTMIT